MEGERESRTVTVSTQKKTFRSSERAEFCLGFTVSTALSTPAERRQSPD